VACATGASLDGDGTGQPGSDFVRMIDRGMLAGSARAFFNPIRHRWATQAGVTGTGCLGRQQAMSPDSSEKSPGECR
jgi:hypothetical protein